MTIRDELVSFPAIQAAWDHCRPAEASARHLRMLLDAEKDSFPSGLREVNDTLLALLASRSLHELDEQLRALFGSETNWEKANSELLGLGFFAGRNQLVSTGWPLIGFGDTPPFDGRADMLGATVAFDIKPAKGATFQWIRDTLDPELTRWAPTTQVDMSFRTRGNYARQSVAQHRRALVAAFRAFLNRNTVAGLPLTTTLPAGATSIEVTVERYTGDITVSTHVGSSEARAAAIADTMLDHVENKARLAADTGAGHFFLAYVRPHASGASDFTPWAFADLKRSVLTSAANLAHHDRWLGALYLDWTPHPPKVHVLSNPSASWPVGICPRNFERWAMGLSDTLIATRAFERWERRGRPMGDSWDDWLAAEVEVLSEYCGRAGA